MNVIQNHNTHNTLFMKKISIRLHPQLYIFRIIFLLAPFILLSCAQGDSSEQRGPQAINAQGYKAEYQEFTVSIRSTGELISYEEVELRTPVAGNVLSIHFREGQFVEKGALLVEMDSRTWQAQKRGLEAQLLSARSELERREKLLAIEGTSQESVDQSRALVSDLEARIEELSVRIDLAQIRAPFSGRVGMRDFSPGAFLGQGDPITRLVQNQKLKIDFKIPARYASLAREGLDVRIVSSSSLDTTYARIYAVDPEINTNTRSLRLRGMLENGDRKFIPGDFVQVFMETQQNDNAILIPTDAIISELNSQVVFITRNGKATRTEVEIGTSTRGRVNILSGISEGDTILITGLMGIRDGSAVRITELNQEAGL